MSTESEIRELKQQVAALESAVLSAKWLIAIGVIGAILGRLVGQWLANGVFFGLFLCVLWMKLKEWKEYRRALREGARRTREWDERFAYRASRVKKRRSSELAP